MRSWYPPFAQNTKDGAPIFLLVPLGSKAWATRQARFYDFNVWTTKKRVEKLRYMHRNPVKRRLVESPEQWRWSSYRFYLMEEVGSVRVNEGWTKICFEIEQPRLRHCMRSWYPPFAQNTKDGAAIVLLMPARSKAWATRP